MGYTIYHDSHTIGVTLWEIFPSCHNCIPNNCQNLKYQYVHASHVTHSTGTFLRYKISWHKFLRLTSCEGEFGKLGKSVLVYMLYVHFWHRFNYVMSNGLKVYPALSLQYWILQIIKTALRHGVFNSLKLQILRHQVGSFESEINLWWCIH